MRADAKVCARLNPLAEPYPTEAANLHRWPARVRPKQRQRLLDQCQKGHPGKQRCTWEMALEPHRLWRHHHMRNKNVAPTEFKRRSRVGHQVGFGLSGRLASTYSTTSFTVRMRRACSSLTLTWY